MIQRFLLNCSLKFFLTCCKECINFRFIRIFIHIIIVKNFNILRRTLLKHVQLSSLYCWSWRLLSLVLLHPRISWFSHCSFFCFSLRNNSFVRVNFFEFSISNRLSLHRFPPLDASDPLVRRRHFFSKTPVFARRRRILLL